MKLNSVKIGLICFVLCLFNSCAVKHAEFGFGSGSSSFQKTDRFNINKNKELNVRKIKTDDTLVMSGFNIGCAQLKDNIDINSFSTPKGKFAVFKSPKKVSLSKVALNNNLQKIQKAMNHIIPPENSHWLKWVLFGLYSLCILLGLIFVLYSFKSTLDSFERDVFQAAGIILLLVSFLYKLGLKIFDTLPQRGIIFKIGMWTTLFGWFTFFSLAVSIPLWIIGAIFDI